MYKGQNKATHEILLLYTSVSSEDSCVIAHVRSLARAFAARVQRGTPTKYQTSFSTRYARSGSFMQTKHLCALIHIWTKGKIGAPFSRFKPSSNIFLLTVPRRCFFSGLVMLFLSCFVMLSCMSVCWCLVVTCWEWADLLTLVGDVVTFPLVSWVRCDAWLYRFLIFALFLTFIASTIRPV